MGKHAVRLLVWAALAALAIVVAGGCSAIVGVDFGAVHAADGGEGEGGEEAGADSSLPAGDAAPPCKPKTCSVLGFKCGTQDDGCGNALDCGTCAKGTACMEGQCACVPTTCPALGVTCGTVDDGCGGALHCGTCGMANQACQNGQCVCTPQSCAAQGAQCGTVPDGCGGTYDCGTCPTATPNCGGSGANQCGANPCVPLTCQTGSCGQQSDNCGGVLTCPDCTAPETCGGGGTANVCGCTPTTCAAQGKNCGTIPDGCGNMLTCGTCTAPETCAGAGTANVCGCTPTTCAALDKNCGAVADGCGTNLDCGTCSGVDTCGGGGTADVCGCTPVCDGCCGGPNGCGGTCAVKPCCDAGCFVGGTLVSMADGTLEPIESVRVGEMVRAYDDATHGFVAAPVLETMKHDASASSDGLVVVNGSLRATTNHPFWVDGRRVRADQLDLGSVLTLLSTAPDGRVEPLREPVRSLELVAGQVPTFDLRVGGPGTYVVGGIVVLVKQ